MRKTSTDTGTKMVPSKTRFNPVPVLARSPVQVGIHEMSGAEGSTVGGENGFSAVGVSEEGLSMELIGFSHRARNTAALAGTDPNAKRLSPYD